jgi:hypothetical protein
LEIPTNYGGQFHFNQDRLNELYSSTRGPNVPSTSQYQYQQASFFILLNPDQITENFIPTVPSATAADDGPAEPLRFTTENYWFSD